MLGQRIVTAIVLLVVLGAALMATSPWPLALLLTLAASCALWEWLRLVWPRASTQAPLWVAVVVAVLMLAACVAWLQTGADRMQPALAAWHRLLMPLVTLAWVLGATAQVARGRVQPPGGSGVLSVFGVAAVWAAWAALLQLYVQRGAWFLVSLLALIWLADIVAYFAGRALGRHKLAPRVSPGKTWEGAIAGMAAAAIWTAASSIWPGSFGAALAQAWAWPVAALAGALLAALSIVGDLFESLLKRRAGVKDSSTLLPGHGGVYDRLDALLPVAPVAILLLQAGGV